MKEKVWVYIPQIYKDKLEEWSKFYSYDTSDEEHGKLVAYSLYTHSKEYKSLVKFLEENGIYNYIFRRDYKFTQKEIDDSEILRLSIDDDAKDSYIVNESNERCNKCGNKMPLIKRDKVHVDYKKIKKYDIMATYIGVRETIVSEKVRELFEVNNISEVEYEPIYQMGKENEKIEGFYHLILKEGIGEIVEPSITEKGAVCDKCGYYNYFCIKTPFNFKRATWKNVDICYTKDWFGGPPVSGKALIISHRLYRILKDNNIKNVYFKPAYFVD